MHPSTFEYLKPTDGQMTMMAEARAAAAIYANTISGLIPDGPDKTYIVRRIRETAMWINVAITREADGSPRTRCYTI
jgi:hypothetical protein